MVYRRYRRRRWRRRPYFRRRRYFRSGRAKLKSLAPAALERLQIMIQSPLAGQTDDAKVQDCITKIQVMIWTTKLLSKTLKGVTYRPKLQDCWRWYNDAGGTPWDFINQKTLPEKSKERKQMNSMKSISRRARIETWDEVKKMLNSLEQMDTEFALSKQALLMFTILNGKYSPRMRQILYLASKAPQNDPYYVSIGTIYTTVRNCAHKLYTYYTSRTLADVPVIAR